MRPGTSRAARGAEDQERRDQRHDDEHEQRGIGEGEMHAADRAEVDDAVDPELMDRIDLVGSCFFHASIPFSRPSAGPSLHSGRPSLPRRAAPSSGWRRAQHSTRRRQSRAAGSRSDPMATSPPRGRAPSPRQRRQERRQRTRSPAGRPRQSPRCSSAAAAPPPRARAFRHRDRGRDDPAAGQDRHRNSTPSSPARFLVPRRHPNIPKSRSSDRRARQASAEARPLRNRAHHSFAPRGCQGERDRATV